MTLGYKLTGGTIKDHDDEVEIVSEKALLKDAALYQAMKDLERLDLSEAIVADTQVFVTVVDSGVGCEAEFQVTYNIEEIEL